MEESLKRLRLTRGQLKGTVTRIENFVMDTDIFSSATIEMLLARKEKLISTFKDYEIVQLEILSLDENDSENMGMVEEKYYNIISKVNAAIKNLQPLPQPQQNNGVPQSMLPNIDIPIFNGKDFTKFTPFMELFTAIIHNNTTLTDIQRLFYLRKFLVDDALSVIINLPLNNDSYRQAINLLNKRFGNKTRLISNHINIILALPSMQKGTAPSIRSFVSGVQQELHALRNLQQPVDQWDMILISILTKKLDHYTNRAFQLERNTDVLPTMTELITFLEKRAMALEECAGTSNNTNDSESKKYFPNKVANVITKKPCLYCEGVSHAVYGCPVFKMAAIEERIKFVESKKLCHTCLNIHEGKCKFNFVCQICKAGHHTLLHRGDDESKAVNNHSHGSSKDVLLPTIKVKLTDCRGQTFYVKALLDCGSQASFATTSLVEKLGLNAISQSCNIVGIGNKNNKINKYVDIAMHSPVNNVQLKVKCHVVDVITSNLPQQRFDISQINLPKNIRLSDDDFNIPCEISILLGADIYFNILLEGQIKIQNGPMLQNTLFGYTIGGSMGKQNAIEGNLVNNFAICDSNKLENVMEQFWLSETIPEPNTKCLKEFEKAEQCFQESAEIIHDKFVVNMPLKAEQNELQLGDSFAVALQRFLMLEKKFKRNILYLEEYKKFIEEYFRLGHAKKVHISTYDVLCGYDILLLWRTFIDTLNCDITKMFRGIQIKPLQTTLQNILWRGNPSLPIANLIDTNLVMLKIC